MILWRRFQDFARVCVKIIPFWICHFDAQQVAYLNPFYFTDQRKSFADNLDPDETPTSCLIRIYTVCLFLSIFYYSVILFSIFVYATSLIEIMKQFHRRKSPPQTLRDKSVKVRGTKQFHLLGIQIIEYQIWS